jgi:hypothetical protein
MKKDSQLFVDKQLSGVKTKDASTKSISLLVV